MGIMTMKFRPIKSIFAQHVMIWFKEFVLNVSIDPNAMLESSKIVGGLRITCPPYYLDQYIEQKTQ